MRARDSLNIPNSLNSRYSLNCPDGLDRCSEWEPEVEAKRYSDRVNERGKRASNIIVIVRFCAICREVAVSAKLLISRSLHISPSRSKLTAHYQRTRSTVNPHLPNTSIGNSYTWLHPSYKMLRKAQMLIYHARRSCPYKTSAWTSCEHQLGHISML